MIAQIVSLLTLDDVLTAIVAPNNIYPDHIAQDSPLPAISMGLVSQEQESSQDGILSAYESTIQIDCWASNHPQAIEIKKAVIDCLADYAGTFSEAGIRIDNIVPSGEVHLAEEPDTSSDDWTYHIALDFQIWHQEI